MGYLKKPKIAHQQPLSLKEFYEKRNKILIWHDKGGLGDALMQRMIFEDFKALCKDADLVFACLPEYIDAVKDHPFISEIIDSRKVNINDYVMHYNTCVTIADRYESNCAPCADHRADIWSHYCGVTLKNHNMCFRFSKDKLKEFKDKIQNYFFNKKPIILFAPVSKMATKSLLKEQIESVVEITKDYNLIGLHNKEIKDLSNLGIPGIYDANVREWMYYVAVSDYVISVDTAAFHMAGGLKKPLVGIFTFADGKVYGKYFDFVLIQKHRDNGNWNCGPCFKFCSCPKSNQLIKPCLTEITKEEIQNGIKEMLNYWKPNRISLI